VEQTLEEIGAGESPRLLVLNKIDLLDEDAREELRFAHPDAVLVSGGAPHPTQPSGLCARVVGEGLEELRARLERELAHTLRPLDLLVPYADGGSLAELHELAGEVSREDTAEGVRVHALVPARLADRFARFAVAS
jgi:GTP-binding protein HflX